MDQPTLHTPRLILRPFQLSDASAAQQLAGAAEVAAMTLTIPHPFGDGIAESWIATHRAAWGRGRPSRSTPWISIGSKRRIFRAIRRRVG